MWQTDYHDRIADWADLRERCNILPLLEIMNEVNNWWFNAPIVNRTIRWNESAFWPNPWELLTNTGYCSLAKALGIAYTLMMIEQSKNLLIDIVETENDNLVLINKGEHILNWAPRRIVNINSTPITISNSINSNALSSF